ncbi:LON peptidase substrate-binding domain-containing protein [Mycobacterium szulgai]|uniref:ATP-dependent protease n=1 Tax=Mycobacterium szulgai TaxID=1787 RepID=A0A1X2E3Q1_MYCSZ|nr:LON peptidase substrate-binding domain-containing protein [Mycobacterium szulgai]MCV7077314.1 LON peptidase substrate-binding domain-containing protein [Mycobacterium szulgai]ORW95011.1 ATP-dependent protease [Mycobacterium szulgai]
MAAVEPVDWAMFPLETALLPNQELPLRIFEPRYSALVHHCIESGEPFGVVLISRGREVGGGDSRCDVGTLARINEYVDEGAGHYQLRCRTGERIRVRQWLSDDPYPRATVQTWPDEPGDPVTDSQLRDIEDQVMALFGRVAAARGAVLPGRDVLLGNPDAHPGGAGNRLYALASRVPIGVADRYAVLAAPSAADRLAALREAVESVAAVVEFELSD